MGTPSHQAAGQPGSQALLFFLCPQTTLNIGRELPEGAVYIFWQQKPILHLV
jgi:hypothetical protein